MQVEINICYYCGNDCSFHSQACGNCMRKLSLGNYTYDDPIYIVQYAYELSLKTVDNNINPILDKSVLLSDQDNTFIVYIVHNVENRWYGIIDCISTSKNTKLNIYDYLLFYKENVIKLYED